MHHDGPAPKAARSRAVWHRARPFFIGVAVGLLVVALLWFAFLDDLFIGFWDEWSRMHDIEELAQSIRSFGNWGVAVSIGLMVVHSFIPFPAEVVALANGIIYGTIFGTLITWIGAMLGAQAAFWTARSFGRSIVERHVRADRRARIDRWIARNGTVALLTTRLIPIIAFNLSRNRIGLGGFHEVTEVGLISKPRAAARRLRAAMLRWRCCSS